MDLIVPDGASGIVLFAHGSGSSRLSPRNRFVADFLRQGGLGTFLFDLLSEEEDQIYENRFDIPLLADRLVEAIDQVDYDLPLGLFGSSTGAAAALIAAADRSERVGAVVSRGGRPDLAVDQLERVTAPTLLIVGELDSEVIRLNEMAYAKLRGEKVLTLIAGATHLFEEEGALEQVALLARNWFQDHL